MPEDSVDADGVSRRVVLRWSAAAAAGGALAVAQGTAVPWLGRQGLLSADGAFAATSIALADQIYIEAFPTSPLILSPFRDELPVPMALRPEADADYKSWTQPPGPGLGQQNSIGNQQHQLWPGRTPEIPTLNVLPDPIVYKIDCLVRQHGFTTSQVLAIDKKGRPIVSFDAAGKTYAAGTKRYLPLSTIYGFNGTFPGPMINAEYGRPALVRFSNRLGENPLGLDRQDFGSPDNSFLTHLHNGHTAPESDGNPHYSMPLRPAAHRLPDGAVGRPAVPELGGRRRRPGEAELLLVPRPPDGPHRLQRLQGHGRAVPDLRPEAAGQPRRHRHGRRAAGPAAARGAHRPLRRLLRRRVRHPAGLLRLPPRRRRHGAQGHPRHRR